MSYLRWNPSCWYVFEGVRQKLEVWHVDFVPELPSLDRPAYTQAEVKAFLTAEADIFSIPGFTEASERDREALAYAFVRWLWECKHCPT